MLHRGLSRITDTESFDIVGDVSAIEAGAPVAGIFNNSKLKLEAATDNSVDATLAHYQFLGFAFNKYCKPASTKFKQVEVKAVADGGKASIEAPADLFDSTTSNILVFQNTAAGKTAIGTKVDSISNVAGATDYFLDASNHKVVVDASLAGVNILVQYSVALSEYAAKLDNQFGPTIFTPLTNQVNVITAAQTVAISSNFVNASGYIAAGVYGKAPTCYLSADEDGKFKITVGGAGSGLTALKNLLFLGFEGDYAVFKLTQNSNLA